MEDKLQKKRSLAFREKTQYVLTFGVIATMLLVANFPLVVVFFFGVFAYFLWKTFSRPAQQGVRDVFEFYLSANEVLRDDERRWFGFEVQEVISHGERILRIMHGAPPLVYFALGALYNKIDDHEAAINHLEYVLENDNSDESTYIHPSGDLRSYVRVLRKIERDPKEAPQTAAAVRSLERARKNRGKGLLEESRRHLHENADSKAALPGRKYAEDRKRSNGDSDEDLLKTVNDKNVGHSRDVRKSRRPAPHPGTGGRTKRSGGDADDLFADRKPITEVLHDIYDKNVQ